MKKTLSVITIASSLAGSLLSSQAYAKIEGSYLGVDVLRSSTKAKGTSSLENDNMNSNEPYYNQGNARDSDRGVGVNYKYAFNFNDFFVAPGISYDFLNNSMKANHASAINNYFSQAVKLKSALSLRTNFGYDINDQFAFYIPVGISRFDYDIKTTDVTSTKMVRTNKSNQEFAAFIGVGFSYQPIKNWAVNLEYNKYQNLKLTSSTATIDGGHIIVKTNVDMLKLGVSYKF